ncbi:MAG: Mut7-C RNAse domain-containing protein, partial [Pseudomonadota bacterium]
MAQIRVHFYQALNDFIAPVLRNTEIIHDLDRKASVKDVIESFNVPHTEIELILVNGIAVDFNYIVQDTDTIQVYPTLENPGVASLLQIRPESTRPPVFVVDANLGKLARYLRLLGFDCLYRNDYDDNAVAKIASEQQRTVLTRDRSLLQHRIITHGYFVRSDIPKIQTKEVLKRFDLYPLIKPLTRCTHCNGVLVETDKQKIEHRLKPLTKKYYDRFLICSDCHHIYWQGSHCGHINHLV